MSKLRKIDNIMFRVSNLDEAAKFYCDILGLKQVWRDDEYHMIGLIFSESDSEIVIHSNSNIPNPDFSFLVDNVDEFVYELKQKKYKILKEPFTVRSGKFAVISDPDGNVINIIDLTKFDNKPRYD